MAPRREKPHSPPLPDLPWSLGIVIAGLLYAALRLLLVGHPGGGSLLSFLTNMLRTNIGLVLLVIGVGVLSRIFKRAWRTSSRPKVDLAAVRALPWHEFKPLCGDALGVLGYQVQLDVAHRMPYQVDLILRRGNEPILVYCSRWRSLNVGIKEVRELHAAVVANQAARGIFVTSGTFSGAATLFAQGKPLDLIDGDRLAHLLGELRQHASYRTAQPPAAVRPDTAAAPPTGTTTTPSDPTATRLPAHPAELNQTLCLPGSNGAAR